MSNSNLIIELAKDDVDLKAKLLEKTKELVDSVEFTEEQMVEIGESMKNAIISTIGDATGEDDIYQAVSSILENKLDAIFTNNIHLEIKPSSTDDKPEK